MSKKQTEMEQAGKVIKDYMDKASVTIQGVEMLALYIPDMPEGYIAVIPKPKQIVIAGGKK